MKKSDGGPLSTLGGHFVDCKRPGLRLAGKEIAQRLLFNDSEDPDLTQEGVKNTQLSSASVSKSGFCQEINHQNKGSATQ